MNQGHSNITDLSNLHIPDNVDELVLKFTISAKRRNHETDLRSSSLDIGGGPGEEARRITTSSADAGGRAALLSSTASPWASFCQYQYHAVSSNNDTNLSQNSSSHMPPLQSAHWNASGENAQIYYQESTHTGKQHPFLASSLPQQASNELNNCERINNVIYGVSQAGALDPYWHSDVSEIPTNEGYLMPATSMELPSLQSPCALNQHMEHCSEPVLYQCLSSPTSGLAPMLHSYETSSIQPSAFSATSGKAAHPLEEMLQDNRDYSSDDINEDYEAFVSIEDFSHNSEHESRQPIWDQHTVRDGACPRPPQRKPKNPGNKRNLQKLESDNQRLVAQADGLERLRDAAKEYYTNVYKNYIKNKIN